MKKREKKKSESILFIHLIRFDSVRFDWSNLIQHVVDDCEEAIVLGEVVVDQVYENVVPRDRLEYFSRSRARLIKFAPQFCPYIEGFVLLG